MTEQSVQEVLAEAAKVAEAAKTAEQTDKPKKERHTKDGVAVPRAPKLDENGNPVARKPRAPKLDENGNPVERKPRTPKLDENGNPIPRTRNVIRDDQTLHITDKGINANFREGTKRHEYFHAIKDGMKVGDYFNSVEGGRAAAGTFLIWYLNQGFVEAGGNEATE